MIKIGCLKKGENPNDQNSVKIEKNDILNFFFNTLYLVQDINEREISLCLIREMKKPQTADRYQPPNELLKNTFKEDGILIVSRKQGQGDNTLLI